VRPAKSGKWTAYARVSTNTYQKIQESKCLEN
jgi:hypothetical protein